VEELGFDGIDLCVRDGGHDLPDQCEDEPPKAEETILKGGPAVPMITLAIVGANSTHAKKCP
jgi:hypothetical protein